MEERLAVPGIVTEEDRRRARERIRRDRAAVIARNATTSMGIRAAARVPEAVGRVG